MLKRKEAMDDVADDFSEFSLSAPSRKTRRLDVDVPLFVNNIEEESPMVFEDVDLIEEKSGAGYVPPSASNESRAIVLYNPTNAALGSNLSSGVSFWVDSNLISSIKDGNKKYWANHDKRSADDIEEEEAATGDGGASRGGSSCLALVPWLPSQMREVDTLAGSKNPSVEVQMECGEAMDAMTMDVEDEACLDQEPRQAHPPSPGVPYASLGMDPFGGLQQWQQQHCMYPNAQPSSTSAAVTWSW